MEDLVRDRVKKKISVMEEQNEYSRLGKPTLKLITADDVPFSLFVG